MLVSNIRIAVFPIYDQKRLLMAAGQDLEPYWEVYRQHFRGHVVEWMEVGVENSVMVKLIFITVSFDRPQFKRFFSFCVSTSIKEISHWKLIQG